MAAAVTTTMDFEHINIHGCLEIRMVWLLSVLREIKVFGGFFFFFFYRDKVREREREREREVVCVCVFFDLGSNLNFNWCHASKRDMLKCCYFEVWQLSCRAYK